MSQTNVAANTPAITIAQTKGANAASNVSVTLGKGKSKPGDETQPIEDILDSTAVSALLSDGLKEGDRITINGAEGELLTFSKKGVSKFDMVKKATGDFLKASAAEASNVVAQDPAFAFKEAAFAVQTQVFSGVSGDITSVAEQAFLPMVRVVSLALDLKKAHATWKSERATKADKAVDGIHLFTDIVGIGGAVALALPAIGSGVGMALSVVGLMGDVASYGYHVMKYFQERGADYGPPEKKAQVAPQA